MAAGCGGDGDKGSSALSSGTTSSGTTSSGTTGNGAATGGRAKAAFVARANAACAEGNTEGQSIQRDIFPKSGQVSPAQVQEFFKTALPVYKRTDAALAALSAPPGDAQQVAALIAAAHKGEAGVAAAASSPDKAKAALQTDPYAEFSARARAYGLASCAGD